MERVLVNRRKVFTCCTEIFRHFRVAGAAPLAIFVDLKCMENVIQIRERKSFRRSIYSISLNKAIWLHLQELCCCISRLKKESEGNLNSVLKKKSHPLFVIADSKAYISGICCSCLILSTIRLVVAAVASGELSTSGKPDQASALIMTANKAWTLSYKCCHGLPLSFYGRFIWWSRFSLSVRLVNWLCHGCLCFSHIACFFLYAWFAGSFSLAPVAFKATSWMASAIISSRYLKVEVNEFSVHECSFSLWLSTFIVTTLME